MNNTVLQPNEQLPPKYADFMKTGREIDQVISKDSNYIDLADMLRASTSGTYALPLISSEREFSQVGKISIPTRLYNRIASIQCRTFSGIFPQISRAWLTIDNILYLWDYTQPDPHIFEYKDQDQVIVAAEIIKPRKGLFDESIKYVIAVATPLQVIFIAASMPAQSNNNNTLHYLKSDNFQYYATRTTITIDEVRVRSMIGTDDGRLFIISIDGGLHEIVLTPSTNSWLARDYMVCRTSNWAPSILQKVMGIAQHPFIHSAAVDNERQVLYLLCEKSIIEIVQLSDPRTPYKPIVMYQTAANDAVQLTRQSGKPSAPTDFEIESIHVISVRESQRYHLMAVTKTGYRLYFSHHQDGIRSPQGSTGPPNALVLGHIRYPPVERRSATKAMPVYSKTFYRHGLCISVRPRVRDDLADSLQIASVGTGKNITSKSRNKPTTGISTFNTGYYETRALLDLPEKVIAIVELESERNCPMNEASEQLSNRPRQFAVLSTQSITFFQKERPVDMLHYLIKQSNQQSGKYKQYLENFSEKYSKQEACAMCLSVACHSSDPRVISTAVSLFERFGGQPSSIAIPQVLTNPMIRVTAGSTIIFSGKRDGLLLYFARIISPVWKFKFFTPSDLKTPDKQVLAKLNGVKENLVRLRDFLNTHSSLHQLPHMTNHRFEMNELTNSLEDTDRQSMHNIYLTLVKAIEAISFVIFAVEATMYTGIDQFLSDNIDKGKVYILDICSILTTVEGREFVDEIVIGTIVRFGSGYSHVGHHFVSEELQSKCEHFFGPSNIAFYKGLEHLLAVDYADSEAEKERDLRQSLACFKQAADEITKLSSICAHYKKYAFHTGIIELVLERAHKIDPMDQALLAYDNPEMRDGNNIALFEERWRVYEYIIDALADVAPIQTTPGSPERKPVENPINYYQTVLEKALRSTDRLFQYKLYDWLIKNNMMEELLSVNTPTLLQYLERSECDKKMRYEFLYRYHRNRQDNATASKCLAALAYIENITLEERINYFSNAIFAAQCMQAESPDADQEYYYQLVQRAEWAQLQKRVREVIRIHGGQGAAEAVKSLNDTLFSPEQLCQHFSQFPQVAQLLEQEANASH